MDAVLFPTCLVELVRPKIASDAERLLTQRGWRVRRARGGACCGQPAWNAGFAGAARRVARRALRSLRGVDGPIVVPSGSCATMMHEYWPQLFAGTRHEPAAIAAAARVRELTAFLVANPATADAARANPATADADPATPGATVAYHDSCHMLRSLGIRDQPRTLLAQAGYACAEMEGAARCCGFGGTFSVKLPELSTAMADDKVQSVQASGATVLVGSDLSCLMHIGGRAGRLGADITVTHVAELLAGAGPHARDADE